MRNLDRLIEGLKSKAPYLAMAEDGRTPEEVKAHASRVLGACLQSPASIENIPLPALAHEAVAVESLRRDKWASAMFDGVLTEYRNAAQVDDEASMRALEDAEPAILKGMSEFMSLYLLERDLDDLDLEECRLEASRSIGGLVEGCLKPQLQALLHQVRVRRGKRASFADIAALKLGNIVQELSNLLENPELVAPPPWGVSLSQWRNIAQHHDSVVEGDCVVCRYNIGQHEASIRLSREDLVAVIVRLQQVLAAIRAARSIVVLENLDRLTGRVEPQGLRPDVAVFHIATAIATQGFEVVDFETGDSQVVLSVSDATQTPSIRRMIHASQFVVPVWQAFPRDSVVVRYLDTAGDVALTATAAGVDCERVGSGDVPFEELASLIQLDVADKWRV